MYIYLKIDYQLIDYFNLIDFDTDLPVADEALAASATESPDLVDAVRVWRAVVRHLRALVHVVASSVLLLGLSINNLLDSSLR